MVRHREVGTLSQLIKLKRPKTARDRADYIAAMWQLFLLQNGNPKPLDDGSFYLGNIENPAPKTWSKATPYSIARRKS